MTYYVVVRLAPGTDVSRAFPLSALYARHFTCVLTCLWACVPVQRMARDALCATRVWDAAEPEVIYTHALRFSDVCRPGPRSFGEVLLYFRPLERCEEQSCTFFRNTPNTPAAAGSSSSSSQTRNRPRSPSRTHTSGSAHVILHSCPHVNRLLAPLAAHGSRGRTDVGSRSRRRARASRSVIGPLWA